MNHDKPDCAEHCALAAYCTERNECAAPPPPLSLSEALRRFEREATHTICDTERYRANCWSWGQGPPLLFVHGISGTSRSFVLLAALLAPRFRCIAYDLPNGPPLARYTHTDLAADLFAVQEHYRLSRSYVYGASFGATIALAALAARPERLPRAILQSGFARRPMRSLERWLARLGGWMPGTLGRFPLWRGMLRRLHVPSFADRPPEVWSYFESQACAAPIRTAARLARMTDSLDLRSLLPQVRQPVLLIDGDRDPLVDRSCSEELLRGLPNARQIELVGCGHLAAFTHPEPLAALVCEFLTPPAPAAAGPLHRC